MKKFKDFNDGVVKQFENITAVLETQSKLINDLQQKVDFLMKNDRDSVRISHNLFSITTNANYIYDGELCSSQICIGCGGLGKIVENSTRFAIIEIREYLTKSYYKLDKKNRIVVDITDEYQKLLDKVDDKPKKRNKKNAE